MNRKPAEKSALFRTGGGASLFWRLLLWFCLANVITLVVTISVAHHIARDFYASQVNWEALAVHAISLYPEGGKHPGKAMKGWREGLHHRHISVGLIDASGKVRMWPPHMVLRQRAELSSSDYVVLHPKPGITLAGVTVMGPDGRPWRFVGAQFPSHRKELRWLAFGIEILVSLIVIGVVGWWIARSIGKPVGAVQLASRRFARGELDARVGAPVIMGKGRLAQLGRDFDDMAARIQSLLERQRGVLQDVSHELRSPLTRLGLTLELARSETGERKQAALDRAEREIARLDDTIGQVLELSRMETQLPGMQYERQDLTMTVDAGIDRLIEDDGVDAERWERQLARGCFVLGNPALLERVIDNLLSNAVKYSPADTPIDVRLQRRDERIVLEVADRGPGVPERELDSLFRPFFRGANAAQADGHGLGLAIVARIVDAHGGQCSARNRDGGGLCLQAELPAADAPE